MSKMELRAFAFVGTPADITCQLPFELGEGITLDIATERERRKVKRYLRELGGNMHNYEPFECEFKSTPTSVGDDKIEAVILERKRRAPSHWRYYVVRLKRCPVNHDFDDSVELKQLFVSSHLTRLPLRLSPLFFFSVVRSSLTADWEFFTGMAVSGWERVVLYEDDLKDLQYCYLKVGTVAKTHPEIAHSLSLYHELPNRLGHNELTTLGQFAVLESLLTHNPKGEHDSIGHQIRTKVALLEKRLRFPIDYAGFSTAPRDTIWKKLYELRSRIAHGSPIDFEQSLSMLNDAYTVELFMRRTLRSFLRGALEEPDLYVDLKAI